MSPLVYHAQLETGLGGARFSLHQLLTSRINLASPGCGHQLTGCHSCPRGWQATLTSLMKVFANTISLDIASFKKNVKDFTSKKHVETMHVKILEFAGKATERCEDYMIKK